MNIKNNHMLIMLLACGVPLLLILFLPFFGFAEEYIYFLAILLMVGLHFLMMGSHGHGQGHDHGQEHQTSQKNTAETEPSDPLKENTSATSHKSHDFYQKPQRRQF